MYKLNNKTIKGAFTHEGIQYPSNWLSKASQADKDALGITWEEPPIRYDQRFYWGVDNPKMLEDRPEFEEDGVTPIYIDGTKEQLITSGLKTTWINTIKRQAFVLLSETDWYISRAFEGVESIPAEITAERASIRIKAEEYIQLIKEATTVEELKAIVSPVSLVGE